MAASEDVTKGHRIGHRVSWEADGVAVLGQVFKVVPGVDEPSTRVHVVSDAWKGVQAQPRKFTKSDAPLPSGVRAVTALASRQRVSFEAKGKGLIHGTVRKVTKEGDAVVVSDDGYEYKGTAAMFAVSSLNAPEPPAKGARVEWKSGRGKLFLGVVIRSSSTMVEVMHDGGEVRSSGAPGVFSPSAAPLPADAPSPIDDWHLEAFREGRRRPGAQEPPFRAVVTHGGHRAFVVSGEGPGNELAYSGGSGARSNADRFEEEARRWAERHGGHDLADPAAAYLVYRGRWAPYGVLSDEFVARLAPPSPAP